MLGLAMKNFATLALPSAETKMLILPFSSGEVARAVLVTESLPYPN
ncbi:hypothetical protein E2C01_102401 [Portunus trituberculatus]|uniref:Uncharacterized protein n=1 Tax=Portunus trituberculatus TaxID=210409 RepID=A0A5B7KD23_PORTR|nr:hypothetical protein [Portunus trituberculatus]